MEYVPESIFKIRERETEGTVLEKVQSLTDYIALSQELSPLIL